MTEIMAMTFLDWAILLFEMIIAMVVYAIVKGWYDNRKWEKHIYLILEEYRAKYGVDTGCEMLLYKKVNNIDDERLVEE